MFILPESVVFFGGGKLNFETKWIGSILDSEEYAFFEEHLNPSIYDCLESKIEPCGIVSMWESCKTYMIGDYVLYNGLVYKFIGTDSTTPPCNDSINWEKAKRFVDDNLNKLWDRHLMTILATKIYMAAIPASTYQVSAVGATALTDTNDGLRGVTKAEISFLMDSLGQRFYNKVQHMKNYISNNLDTLTCFDSIGGCGDNGIRNEKKGSTKIYFL